MTIHLAYDANGNILTAVPRTGSASGPTLTIAPQHGAEIGDFDVPEEFVGKQFHEFMHLLRVDTTAKRLAKRYVTDS
jgi:hypothetical protein